MKYFGNETGSPELLDKEAVLIVNLGSPQTPTTRDVRTYLKQFLSDPRVVEVPRLIWWLILNLVILRIRPTRSARNYQKVWSDNGAPLLEITRKQAVKLQKYLDDQGSNRSVYFAMRYGQPSMASVCREMQEQGIGSLTVLPLYPQYSGSTTGSVFDELSGVYRTFRQLPRIQFINSYYSSDLYIQACVSNIRTAIEANGKPDQLVLSYHGTPQSYREKGDPYYAQCLKTTELIEEGLKDLQVEVRTLFQSRFGREPWLQPYIDLEMAQLPGKGVKSVAVFCPGFSADCLETLEEIAMENREIFLEAGGQNFHYIPCLNDQDAHIRMMAEITGSDSL